MRFVMRSGDGMLYSVSYLGTLCVVEAVNSAYQIAGDAADPLEGNICEMIININIIAVNCKVDRFYYLAGIKLVCSFDVGVDLSLGKLAFCNVYLYHINYLFLVLSL